MAAGNKPVHEIRLGKIKASVWANETSSGIRHNVTVGRLYKEKEGEPWRTSDSFGREDLPLLRKVLDLVHTWLYEQAE